MRSSEEPCVVSRKVIEWCHRTGQDCRPVNKRNAEKTEEPYFWRENECEARYAAVYLGLIWV